VEYLRVRELIKSAYDHLGNDKEARAFMVKLEDLLDEILAENSE
jgi:hypothetical protein